MLDTRVTYLEPFATSTTEDSATFKGKKVVVHQKVKSGLQYNIYDIKSNA
jgi:hypothetical protein